jgi:2-keto-3-deoxy-L-rhamnonate aldolase RhmA
MKNIVKQKLNNGKVSLGSWLTLSHGAIAEIMAESGFDWLAIDMEHTVIGIQDVEPLVRAIEASGGVPLVRLSSNDPVLVKRVMDTGSYGVIVPMVNTREEAEKAVRSVKYSPEGDRSVGLYRAQGWGERFDEYKNTVNKESLVIVQIEHKQAVENIADILAVPGIDGVMIGPYDISGSLGVTGDLDHPLVQEARRKVLAGARAAKKAAGIHVVPPVPADVKDRVKEGFTFIAYSTDAIMLNVKCREATTGLKSFIDKDR